MPEVQHRIELDFPREDVSGWHERPGALERLVPPWANVRVQRGAGGPEMRGRVDLRWGLGLIGLPWKLHRTECRFGELLVYEQRRGPFQHWRWERRFEPGCEKETALVDLVSWSPPSGMAGRAFSESRVRRTLERVVDFQARRLAADLDRIRRLGPGAGRRVAITGSSGLIGAELGYLLEASGYQVQRISRSPRGKQGGHLESLRWDPESGELPGKPLEGLHAFVHLAGESIAGVRWTRAKKAAILSSREKGTALVSRTLSELNHPPQVLISSSAVGFYGHRGNEILSEESGPGDGFLSTVCTRSEASTHAARACGIRTVHMRSGLVLSAMGGALRTLLIPFGFGLGGRIGSGRQYLSWIDLDDEIGMIVHCIEEGLARGAVNATSPNPVTNTAFTDILGRVLSRPTLLPVPAVMLGALMGEMGTELLLSGQRAVPKKASDSGYRFLFPDLEDSLRHQLGRREGTDE